MPERVSRERGRTRLYSPEQVDQICALLQLRQRGVTLKSAAYVTTKHLKEIDVIVSAIDLLRRFKVEFPMRQHT